MARKGENIYKRKDGRWEGRYIKSRSSTGKANYGYVYAKSYREVKAKLISQSSCTSNSVTVDPEISSDQFEQVAMEWFQAICPKVKESTSNKYRNLLSSYILPVFGSKQLRDITHEFIETQCNFFLVSGGLKENGLSSKTVSDILSLIRNVLQFATRNGKAISCDARSIQIKRQTKEMRVLSRAEQEKLCQYLYSNLDSCNIGILVCLFTGLRVGEICALRWEDVSFSDYTIHVHQTLQRIQDRTNSEYKTRIVVTTPKSACSIKKVVFESHASDIYLIVEEGFYKRTLDIHRTLGLLLHTQVSIQQLLKLPAECFHPKPKVNSVLIKLTRHTTDVPDKYWKLYTYFVSKWVNREYRQLFTKNQFHQAMKHAKVNNLSTVTYEQVLSIFNSYLLFNGRK